MQLQTEKIKINLVGWKWLCSHASYHFHMNEKYMNTSIGQISAARAWYSDVSSNGIWFPCDCGGTASVEYVFWTESWGMCEAAVSFDSSNSATLGVLDKLSASWGEILSVISAVSCCWPDSAAASTVEDALWWLQFSYQTTIKDWIKLPNNY